MSDRYFKICPECGDHLDPGERCECKGRLDICTAAHGVSETYVIVIDVSQNSDEPCFAISQRLPDNSVRLQTVLFGQEALDAYAQISSMISRKKPLL